MICKFCEEFEDECECKKCCGVLMEETQCSGRCQGYICCKCCDYYDDLTRIFICAGECGDSHCGRCICKNDWCFCEMCEENFCQGCYVTCIKCKTNGGAPCCSICSDCYEENTD